MMSAKKSLGQHFLMHRRIAERMVHSSGVTSSSVVLEIGPGTGVLTRELLRVAGTIVAVEADAELVEELKKIFAEEIDTGKLVIEHGDIRSFDPSVLPNGYHVVANIPYYITGEIMRQFLEARHQPASMTLLVQKEVADRIARSKKESILSLSIKAYGEPRYLFTVPKGAFRPAPRVDSAVLHIKNISRKNFISSEQEEAFFDLLHTGFAHKRKKLTNNLGEKYGSRIHIPEDARAEDMPLLFWLTSAHTVVQKEN